MQQCFGVLRWLGAVSGVGVLLIATTGCQTWRSSSVVPGVFAQKGERQILRQAKQDPFPSPSDVGMKKTL